MPRARNLFVALLVPVGISGLACKPTDPPETTPAKGVEQMAFSPKLLVGLSEEPVFAVAGGPQPTEEAAVRSAISGYRQDLGLAGFQGVDDYLTERASSPYAGPLALSAGLAAYEGGYWSKAMDYYRFAWNRLAKDPTDEGQAIADRALAELGQMHCRFGNRGAVRAVLALGESRRLLGVSRRRMEATGEALWSMEHNPAVSFQCGPFALDAVSSIVRGKPSRKFRTFPSTQRGTSFAQLAKLARQDGLAMRAVRREPGAKVVVPAVVHWKRGHFGAITKRSGNRYLLVDPTFSSSHWILQDAIDQEASGNFFVPAQELPEGFASIPDSELDEIWGKSVIVAQDDNATRDSDVTDGGGDEGCQPMAQYTFHAMMCSLKIWDSPIAYRPPTGPEIECRVTYLQRDANQLTTPTFTNVGPGWKAPYVAYVVDNASQLERDTKVVLRNGGAEIYRGAPAATGSFAMSRDSRTTLVRTSVTPIVYERRFPDGSTEIYAASNNRAGTRFVFLSGIRDRWGQSLTIQHDAGTPGKIVGLRDALGRLTQFQYVSNAPLRLEKIIDPFGRTATFTYTATSPRLASITDPVGIVSSFTYRDTSQTITAMTTPYGTTSFLFGKRLEGSYYNYYVEATDPTGLVERMEYWPIRSDIPTWDAVPEMTNGGDLSYFTWHNTFYWDKQNYAINFGDYTLAKTTHWLISNSTNAMVSGVPSWIKPPLSARIWFGYQGQGRSNFDNGTMLTSVPSEVARVDKRGRTIREFYAVYNELGNPIETVDPVGRTTRYTYADNKHDVIRVAQGRSTTNPWILARYADYVNRSPQTVIDASGRTSRIVYGIGGLVQSITDAKNQTISYGYDDLSRLKTVTGPDAKVLQSFTYDGADRVLSSTDGSGQVKTFTYDEIDRLTSVGHADGTFTSLAYRYLDLASVRDRRGLTTTYTVDSLRQLREVKDPLGRKTLMDWCRCGSLRRLTDPQGNITSWLYDAEGRPTYKTYADHRTEQYVYDTALGDLWRVFDARGQVREFAYTDDHRISTISTRWAKLATPTLRYTYDSNFPRLTRTVDGRGETLYTYYAYDGASQGAGQVRTVDGPLTGETDRIEFTYDELGRRQSRLFGGGTVSWTYDPLGRVATETNPLGSFTYSYLQNSGLPERISNATVVRRFVYSDATTDRRLTQVVNQIGTTPLSRFTYTHDAEGLIQSWRGAYLRDGRVSDFSFAYDGADQLTKATLSRIGSYDYTYDRAGNRTSERTPTTFTAAAHNPLNQLLGESVSASGNVIQENEYGYDPNGNLTAWNLATPNGAVESRSLTWNAYDQLIGVYRPGAATELAYDVEGRWSRITDQSGSQTVTRDYVWDGSELIGEISSSGTKLYYAQGFRLPNGNRYFTMRDHLGSVREVVDSAGVVVARHQYDPFGNAEVESASGIRSDLGYTGHFTHANTGLVLAPFRAYSPRMGRWLQRDPLGYADGVNVYGYAGSSPTNYIDDTGLWVHIGVGAVVGAVYGGTQQVISDLSSGRGFNARDTAIAAGAGAVGGAVAAALPVGALGAVAGSMVRGAVGGVAESITTDAATGQLNRGSAGRALGEAALGLIPAPKIPGITSGRNSWSAVAKSTQTKLKNGTIKRFSPKTAGKWIGSEFVEGSAGEAAEAGLTLGRQMLPKGSKGGGSSGGMCLAPWAANLPHP